MATAVIDRIENEDFDIYINKVKTIENAMKLVLEDVCNSDMIFVNDYIDILIWATQLKLLYEYLGDNDIEYDEFFALRVRMFLNNVDYYKINPYRDAETAYNIVIQSFKGKRF